MVSFRTKPPVFERSRPIFGLPPKIRLADVEDKDYNHNLFRAATMIHAQRALNDAHEIEQELLDRNQSFVLSLDDPVFDEVAASLSWLGLGKTMTLASLKSLVEVWLDNNVLGNDDQENQYHRERVVRTIGDWLLDATDLGHTDAQFLMTSVLLRKDTENWFGLQNLYTERIDSFFPFLDIDDGLRMRALEGQIDQLLRRLANTYNLVGGQDERQQILDDLNRLMGEQDQIILRHNMAEIAPTWFTDTDRSTIDGLDSLVDNATVTVSWIDDRGQTVSAQFDRVSIRARRDYLKNLVENEDLSDEDMQRALDEITRLDQALSGRKVLADYQYIYAQKAEDAINTIDRLHWGVMSTIANHFDESLRCFLESAVKSIKEDIDTSKILARLKKVRAQLESALKILYLWSAFGNRRGFNDLTRRFYNKILEFMSRTVSKLFRNAISTLSHQFLDFVEEHDKNPCIPLQEVSQIVLDILEDVVQGWSASVRAVIDSNKVATESASELINNLTIKRRNQQLIRFLNLTIKRLDGIIRAAENAGGIDEAIVDSYLDDIMSEARADVVYDPQAGRVVASDQATTTRREPKLTSYAKDFLVDILRF